MARPAFVCCDTDVLIQLLLVHEVRPLRALRQNYSIQPLIVPEVEIELRSNKRHAARIAPELRKAIDSGLLRVLDRGILESHFGSPPGSQLAATAALAQIAKQGKLNLSRVDTGEAYTLAAALVLGVPALSNDRTALDALQNAGFEVPRTVLRTFDLIALSLQISAMAEDECEEFRRKVLAEGESVPACFKNYSFRNGLRDFHPRVRDSRASDVGSTLSEGLAFSNEIDL